MQITVVVVITVVLCYKTDKKNLLLKSSLQYSVDMVGNTVHGRNIPSHSFSTFCNTFLYQITLYSSSSKLMWSFYNTSYIRCLSYFQSTMPHTFQIGPMLIGLLIKITWFKHPRSLVDSFWIFVMAWFIYQWYKQLWLYSKEQQDVTNVKLEKLWKKLYTNSGTTPVYAWKEQGKPWKIFHISRSSGLVWTWDQMNTKQEC